MWTTVFFHDFIFTCLQAFGPTLPLWGISWPLLYHLSVIGPKLVNWPRSEYLVKITMFYWGRGRDFFFFFLTVESAGAFLRPTLARNQYWELYDSGPTLGSLQAGPRIPSRLCWSAMWSRIFLLPTFKPCGHSTFVVLLCNTSFLYVSLVGEGLARVCI